MASINKVILIGNLGRDPETSYTTDGGTAITTLWPTAWPRSLIASAHVLSLIHI